MTDVKEQIAWLKSRESGYELAGHSELANEYDNCIRAMQSLLDEVERLGRENNELNIVLTAHRDTKEVLDDRIAELEEVVALGEVLIAASEFGDAYRDALAKLEGK